MGASSEAADFLYHLAIEYRDAGRFDDAIHELRKLLLLRPQDAKVRRELAALETRRRAGRERAMTESLGQAERTLTAREAAMLEALSRAGQPVGPSPEPGLPMEETVEPGLPTGGLVSRMNEAIAPLAVSGEVRSTVGATRDDFIAWEANGDLNERNFRVFSGPFRYNTFDPRTFSRVRVNLDLPAPSDARQAGTPEATGWQLHSNVTVDPWSFVGTSQKVTVVGDTPTDQVELQLKWWSATNTAINETVLTARNGDSLATPEIEVNEGRTAPTSVTSVFSNVFRIPELEIDYTFQPVRWFWTGYQSEAVDFRVFPLGLEDQAVTSDDPLHLSNHHIYWEPSPWLDAWVPGRLNAGASPVDFTRGEWSDDLTFFTRDSDLTRLTALRGTSFQWFPTERTTLQTAVASPKGLWEAYDSLTSLVGMTRLKQSFWDDRLAIGGLATTRWGFHERRRDATNHVYSLDARIAPMEGTALEAQAATSETIQDRTAAAKLDDGGWAWHAALKNHWWGERLTSRLSYTHMDRGFDPGLASFRQTRDDQFWGRHLRFKRRLRLVDAISPPSAMTAGDLEAVRIGDGVDVGRDAFGLRVAGTWWNDRLQPLFDVRNVHADEGKYIETVLRNENVVKPVRWLTAKTLVLYHDVPDTLGGLDPFMIDDDTGARFTNAQMVDGRNPSLWTFSLGGEVALAEEAAVWAAWERSNDTTLATDNFPRGLLNTSNFTTQTHEGTVIRSVLPILYGQGFFPQPPYPWHDIYRAGAYWPPAEALELAVDWTRNEFEFAGQIDDNP